MPWPESTRRQYCRDERRYASDVTDTEWALIEPFVPAVNSISRLLLRINGSTYIPARHRGTGWRTPASSGWYWSR